MWETRPPRIPKENGGKAMLAGVCEGIGARYQIDPTIVRIAFAVLAVLGGGGILLYLLCWLTMPRINTASSPLSAVLGDKNNLTETEKKEQSTGWILLIALLIFLMSAFPSIIVGFRYGFIVLPLVSPILGLVAWWLLHNRTPVPPQGLGIPPTAPGPQQPQPSAGNPQPQPPAGGGHAQAQAQPQPEVQQQPETQQQAQQPQAQQPQAQQPQAQPQPETQQQPQTNDGQPGGNANPYSPQNNPYA